MTKIQDEWTLSKAARLLDEPQHRLIYLCEKDVVIPDLGEARGRGSSRRFSARNILEFALALQLRQLMIPVAPVAAIMYVLRAFESRVAQEISTFRLPQSLLEPGAPELCIVISDGQRLFFVLRRGEGTTQLYGGLDFAALMPSKKRGTRTWQGASAPLTSDSWHLSGDDQLLGAVDDYIARDRVRIMLNVTRIAQELVLAS